MSAPPSRGRSHRVFNQQVGTGSKAYSSPVDDLLLFFYTSIYLYNYHATETVNYTVEATVSEKDGAPWFEIYGTHVLAGATGVYLTSATIPELATPLWAIRITCTQVDGSNHGKLSAWVVRK